MFESLVNLQKRKICIIGDFMLDSYTKGSVKRISPEGPVCVLKVKKQERLPGGAGNVALNCQALGADVYVIGRIGDDFASSYLKSNLKDSGIDTEGLLFEPGYETPLKNRFMAEHQQLLRVDFEKDLPLLSKTENDIIAFLHKNITSYDLILVSDYNKGLCTTNLLQTIISLACKFIIPVFIDPKGQDFSKYKNATLIKPNLNEAYLASGYDEKCYLDDVAKKLIEITKVEHLLITRSEQGMSLFTGAGRKDFKACVKEVMDVTGAGDTVLATLAVTFASGLDLATCIEWANIAASCAIEKLGCVHVGKKELINAIFEKETRFKYLPLLAKDLAIMLFEDRKIKMVFIDEKNLDFKIFAAISNYKREYPDCFVIAVVPDDCDSDVIKSLCDLNPVNLVMKKSQQAMIEELVMAEV